MKTLNYRKNILKIGLVALLFVFAGYTASADARGKRIPHFTGTYLIDGTIEKGDPALPPFLTEGLKVQMLVTMGIDGNVVVRHNFGPPNQNLDPGLGEWKRTGRRSAKIVYLFINVPRNPDPASTTPELGIFTNRVTVHLEMDREFGIVDGTLVNEFFLSSQDPLDPSETPLGAVKHSAGEWASSHALDSSLRSSLQARRSNMSDRAIGTPNQQIVPMECHDLFRLTNTTASKYKLGIPRLNESSSFTRTVR